VTFDEDKSVPRAPEAFVEGIFVAGAIPDGHEGPYEPILEEYVASIEAAAKSRASQIREAYAEVITHLKDQASQKEAP
jgi:hypothetical protein